MVRKQTLMVTINLAIASAVVQGVILLLRSVAPICCGIVAYYIFSGLPTVSWEWALFLYALLEVFFLVGICVPLRSFLQTPATHPEPLGQEDHDLLLKRIAKNIPDPEHYLERWFLNAPTEEVKMDNIREFISWAFWGVDDSNLVPKKDLDYVISLIKKRMSRKIPSGRGSAKSLRVTLDEIEFLHRPMGWYLFVGVLDCIAAVSLVFSGYSLYREKFTQIFTTFPWRFHALLARNISAGADIPYWYREHKSTKAQPVIFIHGIGLGLFPYCNFLRQLSQLKDEDGNQIGVICIELLAISSRITKPIPETKDLCQQILAILEHHGWDKSVLVGNSYGTMVSSQMLRHSKLAPKIGSMFLVDPVVFLLHQPDIAYNFVARAPSKFMEHTIWFFASKDYLIAHTLQRRMFWIETILWKEELEGRDSTVAIAGRDIIIDAPAVKDYLLKGKRRGWTGNEAWKGQNLEVLLFEDLDHAEMFHWEKEVKIMVKVIDTYCNKTEVVRKRYGLRSLSKSPAPSSSRAYGDGYTY